MQVIDPCWMHIFHPFFDLQEVRIFPIPSVTIVARGNYFTTHVLCEACPRFLSCAAQGDAVKIVLTSVATAL